MHGIKPQPSRAYPKKPIHPPNHDAGVLFLTLSPADIETAVRSGLTLMLQDVCLYTRRRITEVRAPFFGGVVWGGGVVEGEAGRVERLPFYTHTHTPIPLQTNPNETNAHLH